MHTRLGIFNTFFIIIVFGCLITCQNAFSQGTGPGKTIKETAQDIKVALESLKQRYDRLINAFEKSIKSQEDAEREFSELSVLAQEALSNLAEDSLIWKMMNQMLTDFENNAQRAEQKSTGSAAEQWRKVAVEWRQRRDALEYERDRILKLYSENKSLLGKMNTQRELVIEHFKLGDADKAIEQAKAFAQEMEAIRDGLAAMLAAMDKVSSGT